MCFTEERSRHYGHGAAQRRDLLQFARGPDRHRELATPLQHDQAPRLTWIQATSAGGGGVRARLRRVAGCATPSGSASHAGETVNLKLTFHLAHSAGADHIAVAKSLCFNRYLQGRICKTWRATARPSFATSVLRVWSEEQNAWIRAIRTCAPDAIER